MAESIYEHLERFGREPGTIKAIHEIIRICPCIGPFRLRRRRDCAAALPAAPPKPASSGAGPVTAPDSECRSRHRGSHGRRSTLDARSIRGAVVRARRPTAAGGQLRAQKRQVAEQYAELETMAQEARKRKLDESAEVKQMMAIQGDSFLANTL